MTIPSQTPMDSHAAIPATPVTLLFGSCVAYEEDPDDTGWPAFFPYRWRVTEDDEQAVWKTAFEAVRAKGIEHGARFFLEANLNTLSFKDLQSVLLTVGIHMTKPYLLPQEDPSDLSDGQ